MSQKQISSEQVKKIAALAKLNLTEEEISIFTSQLEEVIDYNIEKLNVVNTEKIEPLLNVSGLKNAWREDEAETGLSQEDAVKNAQKTHNGFFEVEQILEQ